MIRVHGYEFDIVPFDEFYGARYRGVFAFRDARTRAEAKQRLLALPEADVKTACAYVDADINAEIMEKYEAKKALVLKEQDWFRETFDAELPVNALGTLDVDGFESVLNAKFGKPADVSCRRFMELRFSDDVIARIIAIL